METSVRGRLQYSGAGCGELREKNPMEQLGGGTGETMPSRRPKANDRRDEERPNKIRCEAASGDSEVHGFRWVVLSIAADVAHFFVYLLVLFLRRCVGGFLSCEPLHVIFDLALVLFRVPH